MYLYHGSKVIVEIPEYGVGFANNDYGLGFYCTEDLELAKEWACPDNENGFANKYELDLSDLKVLDLNDEGYSILNWITLLVKNRVFNKRSPIAREAAKYLLENYLLDISEYDVVCGYRADDSYFSYAKDFLNNVISVSQLSQAMKLGNLGEQVVLISRKAFESIKYTGYEVADAHIYYPRRMQREYEARRAYLDGEIIKFSIDENEIFIRDIITGKVNKDDPCLR